MPTLATSILSRTPDEKTVVADVYTKTDSSVVNSFQDLNLTGFDLSDQFGFLSKFTSGNVLKSATDGALSLDTESLTDKISSAFSDEYAKAKSLVNDVVSGSQSAISAIKSDVNSVTGLLKEASRVYTTVNGIVRAVQTGNLSDLRGIANTINAVTGKVGIALSANGALGGVFSSLVGEAGAQGIQGAFGVIADAVQSSSSIVNKSSMLYTVATGSLPAAVARGDLASVAAMSDYIGNGAVGMLQPNAVSQLARNDKTSYTTTDITGANGQFVQYQGTYQKIDPTWNQSSFQPVGTNTTFKDLSSLLGASVQVKNIFTTGGITSTDSADKTYAALSALNNSYSVDDEIKKRFPQSVSTGSNMVTRDVDPRVQSPDDDWFAGMVSAAEEGHPSS
uniref:Uncharacterized protein n=1 Tax=Burkholderia phage vB_BgluM-SURPRISE13 TaxID=3159457 RepID=A0AAU7PH64_9VIRU